MLRLDNVNSFDTAAVVAIGTIFELGISVWKPASLLVREKQLV